MSPKTGRPKKDDPNVIRTTVNLNRETMDRLEEYSKRNGVTKGETIREAIKSFLGMKK